MRPVKKNLNIDTTLLHDVFSNENMENHLISAIGAYCSYCEKSIAGYEKSHHKLLKEPQVISSKEDLQHMLLSCQDCSSNQKKFPLTFEEHNKYLWPDLDVSFGLHLQSPIKYVKKTVRYIVEDKGKKVSDQLKEMVLIEANNKAGQELHNKAQNTINLFQLNTMHYLEGENVFKVPLTTELQLLDHRIRERNFAWQAAESAIARLNSMTQLAENNTDILNIFHKQITRTAQAKGNWSVWMTVFWQTFQDKNLLEKIFIGDEEKSILHFNGTDKTRIKYSDYE